MVCNPVGVFRVFQAEPGYSCTAIGVLARQGSSRAVLGDGQRRLSVFGKLRYSLRNALLVHAKVTGDEGRGHNSHVRR